MENENELKKEYLRGYQTHVRRIRRIEAELEELRAMKISVSTACYGMPHGSGQSDLSGYAAELDELERKLIRERYLRVKAYKDIVSRVKALKSENEMDVLFYRYIAGYDWWQVAEKLGYSERWILKLHGTALAHFKLPKKKKRDHRSSVQSVI